MQVAVGKNVYRMSRQEYQGLLKVASEQVPFGIYAIEKEDYALAAEFRDQISKLEKESLAASAEALEYANVQYAFRLGQKVRHKIYGIL